MNKEISTHTSLAGRDWPGMMQNGRRQKFLLTRPSRDVTGDSLTSGASYRDFYSHVPRGT